MEYTRNSPSPRYVELADQYRRMHGEGEQFLQIPAEDTFPGLSLPPQAARIKRLIQSTGTRSILDYGSGKGRQYEMRYIDLGSEGVWKSIQEYWGVERIHCYDPNYQPFSVLPDTKSHGVVCTDVLEHCPEEDISWIITEIFSYAERFVFLNVACFPASKRLPSGENAHCTIRPEAWWQALVRRIAADYPGVVWELHAQATPEQPEKRRLRRLARRLLRLGRLGLAYIRR